jgi:hypothetical protein
MLTSNPQFRIQSLKWAIVPILLLALAGGYAFGRGWFMARPAPRSTAMPINPAIEDKWGVRVTQIGVTADGGLVDFRYLVLDPDKALAMLQDVNNLPVLVAEDGGQLVNSAAMMAQKHNLNPGSTYFLLYRNTQGAIKPGGAVTVKFGDLQLEHVVAK